MEKQDHRERVDALKEAHTGTEEELAAALAALPLPRGIAQLRADVLVDLISLGEIDTEAPETTDASSTAEAQPAARATTLPPRGVRGQVLVTVPTRILAGLTEDLGPEASAEAILGKEFAELDGYGVLDDETAERVAFGIGSFRALFTDDRGAILNVGRDSYAPPKALRRFTEIRDQHCRFPGCERAAVRCDLDHSVPWDSGGETCHDNLAFLCRTHHTMKGRGDPGTTGPGKTHNGWTLLDNVNGVLEWETLSGRRATTYPERPSAASETA
ncbi:HNH endonuclease signature motif containing protein [Leucobacter sp. M11]|uniref:HNH endonuclease signature motif containing protein n=1 Tax=Leucobacter sp. M11 TaxID=2993565 RepID=UPI002D7FD2C0|nr:HNH endonuclease signature motif containing protein [Leucobacter sp. M11]MEB4614156.1 HNH endonuclease signature motif containing protein [Leucobacter sp. M11]